MKTLIGFILVSTVVISGCKQVGDEEDSACESNADVSLAGQSLQLGTGQYNIFGVVTLTGAVNRGTRVELVASSPVIGSPVRQSGVGSMSANSNLLTYEVCNLPNGDYTIGVQIDDDGSGNYTAGDQYGYFSGSTGSPIQAEGSATTITINNADRNAGFGIAP